MFELHALVYLARLQEIVLIVDETTDVGLLQRVLEDALEQMPATSPNAGTQHAQIAVCQLGRGDRAASVRVVLARLVNATSPATGELADAHAPAAVATGNPSR